MTTESFFTCSECRKGMRAKTASGCCGARCRAAKSRRLADHRRMTELCEVLDRVDQLRAAVMALLEAKS